METNATASTPMRPAMQIADHRHGKANDDRDRASGPDPSGPCSIAAIPAQSSRDEPGKCNSKQHPAEQSIRYHFRHATTFVMGCSGDAHSREGFDDTTAPNKLPESAVAVMARAPQKQLHIRVAGCPRIAPYSWWAPAVAPGKIAASRYSYADLDQWQRDRLPTSSSRRISTVLPCTPIDLVNACHVQLTPR